jgi:2,4-dihydroxyhept-2-ene-1,7-dioic acid aldolase
MKQFVRAATAAALAIVSLTATAAEYVHMNRTVETLEQGDAVFGLFSSDFSLSNARALARSDLDFVFIDMEHTPFDMETLRSFLLGMQDKRRMLEKGNAQMDVTPIVRIPMYGR